MDSNVSVSNALEKSAATTRTASNLISGKATNDLLIKSRLITAPPSEPGTGPD